MWWTNRAKKQLLKHLSMLPQALGLTNIKRLESVQEVRGDLLAHEVVGALVDGPRGLAMRVSLRDAAFPRSLVVRRRGEATALPSAPPLGDADFDTAVAVEGPDMFVIPYFDATLRLFLVELLTPALTIEGGAIHLEVTDPGAKPLEVIKARVWDMIKIANAFKERASKSVPELLADSLSGELVPAIRRRCITMLADQFPASPAMDRAMGEAVDDTEPSIRLLAALHLSQETSEPIERFLAASDLPKAVHLDAIERLGQRLPSHIAVPVLELQLSHDDEDIRRAALRALE